MNQKPDILSNIKIAHDEVEISMKNRGSFTDLFREGRRALTSFIWLLWFVSALGYYGVVLMSTELLNSSKDYCGHSEKFTKTLSSLNNFSPPLNSSSATGSCSLQCK